MNPAPAALPPVRSVPCTRPFSWLRWGWQDLWCARSASLAQGAALTLFSLLTWGLGRDRFGLLVGALSGFLVLAPVLATGFYVLSRALERGEPARMGVRALSNGNADVHQMGLGHYFHATVSAREAGVLKPDARIFHQAAMAAGVGPDQVLHIGDDAHLDTQGAMQAGLQAVWLNRAGSDWPLGSAQPHATVASLHALPELLTP
ncbi:MAG: HAD-IA family hydrolase [Paenacidovorax caeni]